MVVRMIAARWCGLVASLVAALLVPASPVGAVAGFGDVDGGAYFADAVQWSVDNGITGVDGSCFSPDQPVTRGETAVCSDSGIVSAFGWLIAQRRCGSMAL